MTNRFLLLATFASIGYGDELLSGGVSLEAMGKLYLSKQQARHIIEIVRSAPTAPYENLSLAKCSKNKCEEHFSRDRSARKECDENRSEIRLNALKDSIKTEFQERLTRINAEANLLKQDFQERKRRSNIVENGLSGLREKRDIIAGASILSSVLNFSMKVINNIQIRNLKKLTLHTGNRITELESALKNSMSSVSVAINNTYSAISELEERVCLKSNEQFQVAMHSIAAQATENFLEQIEREIAELATGNIPPTIEYLQLWRSGCYAATCGAMSEAHCTSFCKNLLYDIPREIRPKLLGSFLDSDAIHIVIEIQYPVIMAEPSTLHKVNSFGIVKKVDNEYITTAAQLSPYATSIGGRLFSLNRFECFSSRGALMVCQNSALSSNTCLSDISKCPTKSWYSEAPCTYAYTKDGVVVYAAEQAEHRIRSVASDLARKRDLFSGMRFFPATNKSQEITCGPLLIPIKMTDQIVSENMTIFKPGPKIDFEFMSPTANISQVRIFEPNFKNELVEDIEDNFAFTAITGLSLLVLVILLTVFIVGKVRCINRELKRIEHPLV